MAVTATTTKTATPKAASAAGVKKSAPKGGRAGKKNNARNAMAKMQAYCKSASFDAFWSRHLDATVALLPHNVDVAIGDKVC